MLLNLDCGTESVKAYKVFGFVIATLTAMAVSPRSLVVVESPHCMLYTLVITEQQCLYPYHQQVNNGSTLVIAEVTMFLSLSSLKQQWLCLYHGNNNECVLEMTK